MHFSCFLLKFFYHGKVDFLSVNKCYIILTLNGIVHRKWLIRKSGQCFLCYLQFNTALSSSPEFYSQMTQKYFKKVHFRYTNFINWKRVSKERRFNNLRKLNTLERQYFCVICEPSWNFIRIWRRIIFKKRKGALRD